MNRLCISWMACFSLALSSVSLAQAPTAPAGKDGARMVLVPAGKFLMGSGSGNPDETPPHEREVPAFYIDATEVTIGQYARFVKETGYKAPAAWINGEPPEGQADRPVYQVTWFDAMAYAQWAGKRLPTEAEWEKAARGAEGRRFPWGETPCKECANLGGEKRRPVGQFPRGASPYGAQDMAGNVWEWTADWYEPYPATNAKLIHFGHKYKVMRGGGAAYFYTLNENSGRCSLRGRVLPYAGEDYLGFRCVKDLPGAKPPYDAAKLIAEAQEQLKGALPKATTLSYETEYDSLLKQKKFTAEISGKKGQTGYVRGGVPFPQGVVKDLTKIQVVGPDGKARPTQQKMLTPWKDGSARWVLLDFPASAGEKVSVTFDGAAAAPAGPSIQVQQTPTQLTINTGVAQFTFTPKELLKSVVARGKPIVQSSEINLVLDSGALKPLPAEKFEVEDKGPLHATVRIGGWFADASGNKTPMHYDLRAHLSANSTRANLLLTLAHLQPRAGKEEERKPMAKIVDASLKLSLASPTSAVIFGTDQGVIEGPVGARSELLQPDAVHFTATRDGTEIGKGTKASGWASVTTPGGSLSIGVRHFWQNFAKSLIATPGDVTLRLWAGAEPLEFEATIAKTHEFVLEVSPNPPTVARPFELEPMRLASSPAWSCGTQALGGPMVPRSQETISHMPYWELAREAGMLKWMRAMLYSWRDFGDTRHGGDAKGANAMHNLEYDVPFNFLVQHIATGETWYLDAAEIQCRHQGDIDTDNVTGHPYKHMINHTTWRADIAHMFLRGLVVHYWLTGEQRSLEMARMIGDHIAPLAESFREFGNERQIGWGLYALTGIYEATLDERYLNAANKLCDKLVAEMSPTGKFNIRWDNRMSLMNGMAMNGMMSVQELSGSDKLADGLMRLSTRTLGFYPEYAMRTLHGYAWALTHSKDGRFLDVLARTWESCLELIVKGCDATDLEVHAWRFPWFVAKYRLYPVFDKVPAQLPEAATWRGQWFPGAGGEIYVRTRGGDRAPVMLILHGLAEGQVEVFDAKGAPVEKTALTSMDRLYTPAAFSLPASAQTYRIRFDAPRGIGWEIHHDARSSVTLYDPNAERLSDLYPRAYAFLKPGTNEIKITFEAMGEGSHKIAMFDPAGNILGVAEKFIDYEDKGRYEVELKLPVPEGDNRIWGLEAFNARVLRIEGFMPYWSTEPRQLFNPDVTGKAAEVVRSRAK